MMVAQGKDWRESCRSVAQIATDPKFMYVTTIGIPRLINAGDRHARFKVAKFIAQEGFNRALEVHFLGASNPLDEVGYLHETGVGRGIDTSAPVYMGMKERLIIKHEYVNRPNDYFMMSKDTNELKLNIDTYLKWAQYDRDAELPERV